MSTLRARPRQSAHRRPSAPRRDAYAARALGMSSQADRLDRIAAGPGFEEFEIPSHLPARFRRFRMNPCAGRDQVVAALEQSWGTFEPPMPDAFVALVHQYGGTVLDVGANTGFYSLLAVATRSDVHAMAIEPFPPVAALLVSNIAANQVGRRIEVREVALSDSVGEAELFIPDPSHGLIESSASLNSSFKEAPSGSVRVRVDTLDRLAAEHQFSHPTVIKIDVESLEHAVIRGGRETIGRHRPVVFFEVLHIGEPETIERLRIELDYVDLRLVPEGLIVGEPVQHDPAGWNHLLVPSERLSEILTVLRRVDLPVRAP